MSARLGRLAIGAILVCQAGWLFCADKLPPEGGARIIGLWSKGESVQASGGLSEGQFVPPGELLIGPPEVFAQLQFRNRAVVMLFPTTRMVYLQGAHTGRTAWDEKTVLLPGLATKMELGTGLLRFDATPPGTRSGFFLSSGLGDTKYLAMIHGAAGFARKRPFDADGWELEIYCLEGRIVIWQKPGPKEPTQIDAGESALFQWSPTKGAVRKRKGIYSLEEVIELLRQGGPLLNPSLSRLTEQELEKLKQAMEDQGRFDIGTVTNPPPPVPPPPEPPPAPPPPPLPPPPPAPDTGVGDRPPASR
jgi:hypothetical protein